MPSFSSASGKELKESLPSESVPYPKLSGAGFSGMGYCLDILYKDIDFSSDPVFPGNHKKFILESHSKTFCLSLYQMKQMKAFVSILAVYILILTIIPCVIKPHDTILHQTELSDLHNHHHTDQCSPFCVCHCCTSPIIYQASIFQINDPSYDKMTYPEYQSSFDSSPRTAIWQPPI